MSYITGLEDGSIVAELPDPAVPTSLSSEILHWKEEGIVDRDIHCLLRRRTVPQGYLFTTWKPAMQAHVS